MYTPVLADRNNRYGPQQEPEQHNTVKPSIHKAKFNNTASSPNRINNTMEISALTKSTARIVPAKTSGPAKYM